MDKLILNAKPLLGFDKDYRVTETEILFQWITVVVVNLKN